MSVTKYVNPISDSFRYYSDRLHFVIYFADIMYISRLGYPRITYWNVFKTSKNTIEKKSRKNLGTI